MQKHLALIEKINSYGKNKIPFFLFVDFNIDKPFVLLPDQLESENIYINFPGFKSHEQAGSETKISLKKFPVPFDVYLKKFQKVQQHLHYGNSFLTNLTCETLIEADAGLDDIYHTAKAAYKIKYKDEWVCFSPESFVKISGNVISSYPMKGTIDAALPDAEFIILNDKKEIAEHYTIVDLIRNDMNMVATNVHVKKFRYLEKINSAQKSLLQVSSHIEGELQKDYRQYLGKMLFSLLPAGSISGAPKKKTLEIIHEAEAYERGFYTGTTFYFDGENTDSCVLIRFIEKRGDKLFYKSGGGITIHSDAEKEYTELTDKIYVPII